MKLAGVEVVVLDTDEAVLHRPAGGRHMAVMCDRVLDRFIAGPAPALEPLARSLCADCWPTSDGLL